MGNPVGWFEIYVQDLPRAQKFYEAVLKVSLASLPSPMPNLEMLAFPMEPEGKGAAGALVHMQGAPSGGLGTLVYFSCNDCAIEVSRISAAGGKIQMEKTAIGPYGFIALGIDPDGNMFGLHSLT